MEGEGPGRGLEGPAGGPPKAFLGSNPLINQLQAEEGRCSSSGENSASSSRLQAFAGGSVMQQLAGYMRERRILDTQEEAPHKPTQGFAKRLSDGSSEMPPQEPFPGHRQEPPQGPAEKSARTSESPPATAKSRTATSSFCRTAAASAPDSSGSSKGVSNGSDLASSLDRPRLKLRVCLQPEVGEEPEMSLELSGGVAHTAQEEDGGDESDGGEAIRSKTAAFGFLYDDAMDELDSAWVRKTLRLGEGHTDAVLSCAGCFTPPSECGACKGALAANLSVRCVSTSFDALYFCLSRFLRHESERNLFRAVTAFHVTIKPTPKQQHQQQQQQQKQPLLQQQQQQQQQQEVQPLHQQLQEQDEARPNTWQLPLVQHIASCLSESSCTSNLQQQQHQQQQDEGAEAAIVCEVCCECCGSVVGWQDAEEVFYFSDVIPGEA
ncbi:hypothetical protein Emag_000111 [Eimeria magna]